MVNNVAPATKPPFPFSDCAFYGFAALKGHVREFAIKVALPYALFYLLLTVGAWVFMVGYFVEFASMIDAIDGEDADLRQIFSLIGPLFLSMLVLLPVSLLLYASTINASMRWYLFRDLSGQFGALRFGWDELRTLGVLIVYYVFVFLLPYLLLVAGFIVLAIGAAASVDSGGTATLASTAFMMLIGFPALFIFIVFFGIRLSLCVPLTLERKKLTFWDSMRLTKKRGWALLGAYVILFLIYLVASTIISTIGQVVMVGAMMPVMMDPAISGSEPSEALKQMVQTLTSPGTMIGFTIYALLQTVMGTISMFAFAGLTAYSMRFLQEEKGDIVANLDVFD